MSIYLVRHGEDTNPTPGRLTNEDVPLSDAGKEQATTCGLSLHRALGEHANRAIIFASPRTRTMQAASIIAETMGVDPSTIQVDARLEERNCAAFAGKPVQEVFSLNEEALVSGGMEPYEALYARLQSLYDQVRQQAAPVILVTHSGNIPPLAHMSSHANDQPLFLADTYLKIT